MTDVLVHPESDCTFIGDFEQAEYASGGLVHRVTPSGLPAGTLIGVGLPGRHSEVLPSLDFETYSEAGYCLTAEGKIKGVGPQGKGGLGVVGTPVYAEHPSTEVLCLYYNLKDGKGTRGWLPATPNPQDLLDYVANGGIVEAHNATFEFWIWNVVCVRKLGWPPLPLHQLRCSMAKARRFSLPGSLGKLSEVLGTAQKDKEGARLIQKLCRPHTPTKNRKAVRWTPATAWDDFCGLYSYCGDDTVAEDDAGARIPDLTPDELQTWLVDQTINARGVRVDTATLDAALDVLGQAEERYTAELQHITGGRVTGVSEVDKMKTFLNDCGYPVPNIQKETVDEWLGIVPPDTTAYRVLEIRATLGAANVKKLRTLKLQVNSDGRLRDQYTYCGADRTGRWSAGGVQLQNITAKGPKSAQCDACEGYFGADTVAAKTHGCCPRCGSIMWHTREDWEVDDVKAAVADIAHRNLDHILQVWGDPIALLCGCLRGLFVAPEGKDLLCCDFSAIEAVVAACLSRCMWRVEVFSTPGECIYTRSAADITGVPIEKYKQYKKEQGKHHPDRKKIGKIAELASGYGGWINAWLNFGADMDDAKIKQSILAWRDASPEIVEMWGGQFRQVGAKPWDAVPELYGLEGMAIKAIQNPGECFSYIDITYGVWNDVLYCRLPSGRYLHYHKPRLVHAVDKLNRGPAVSITFEGYNTNSAKGRVGWVRMETFGGRLFENVVQAVSADIQADALKNLEAAGYPVVMHTHDEAVCEVPEGFGSVEEMKAIMSQRPAWAAWWPINAAGWRDKRYQKD